MYKSCAVIRCVFYYDAKLKGKIKIENMASPRRLQISHIFYRISHTLSSHDKHKLLFFFIQQYFSPQPTDIYMQGSIQKRFIKPYSPHYLSRIQTVALQWTDHCTLVNSSVYSSERFYPLEWNEWNVAFIIWKERQSRIRLQSIHLWNSTANDTNGHKKRANHSAPP